jgi:glutathione synthase/RimK-type ligase-like ATP-grasp enzyme
MEPLFGIHAYSNTNTIALVPAGRVSFDHVFMEGITRERARRFGEDYDVIFNNVVNAELSISRGYGIRIRRILEETKLPVVNDPGRVELTLRHVNHARLRHIEHMIFPRTMLLDLRETGEEDALERIAAELAFPVLVRRAGTNRASTLVKADDAESLRAALGRLKGGPVYAIQFHESRHRSGNYLMYRGIFIGGRFHPGRMYMADGWLVSGPAQRSLDRTLIEASPELQDEERAWLADPEAAVGAENLAAFRAMHEVIGLDCYGFDFGLAGDGRAIVFEANAAMNLLSIRRHVPKFPYLAPAAEAITRAIEDLIIARAAEGRART